MNALIYESFAIFLRDWKKMGKLWKFFVFLAIISSGILLIGFSFQAIIPSSLYMGNYSSFFSFGFLVYFILAVGIVNGSDIVLDNSKFIKLLLVAPISKYSILVGKTLSILVGSIRVIFFLGLIFLVSSMQLSVFKMLILIAYGIFLVPVGISTGLFLCTLVNDKGTSGQIVSLFNIMLLFFSGVIFPIPVLSGWLKFVFSLNPFAYVVDLFRYLMTDLHNFSLYADFVIALTFGVIIIFLGIYQFDSKLRRN